MSKKLKRSRRYRTLKMEGGRKMRTLAQIRNDNQFDDLFFVGMEEEPVDIPSEIKEAGKKIYNEFVKPISRRVYLKYIEKTK